MPKPTTKRSGVGAFLSTLSVDNNSEVPLYRQLEAQIRRLVATGSLPANCQLPPTRQLAADLGVSRLTVKNVYEQLVAEGFLRSRQGAGTFVADIPAVEKLPENTSFRAADPLLKPAPSGHLRGDLSSNVKMHLGSVRAFRPSVPALDRFPCRAWTAIYSKVMRNAGAELLGYGPPEGLPELRSAIAFYVRDHRGIQCDPGQIVITSGAQQAFVLIALTLLGRGDPIWFEDPGHIGARDAFRMLGLDVKSASIDEEGLNIAAAAQAHGKARAIFVTPSHQHPLGVTMSLKRRLELLDFAQQNSCLIIEDDYDSENHYDTRALPALQALDKGGHVLYVGSFSKSLFPAIRIGYLICPHEYADAFNVRRTLLAQNVPIFQQTVLARFMLEGDFSAHVRKMRSVYRERRDLLAENIERLGGENFELEPCPAGMHLIGWLCNSADDDMHTALTIWQSGVDCLPISIYCDQQSMRPGIVFGFACAPEREIEKTAQRMMRALK